eukprot:TRINITY_DN6318_c0_g1_i1.p1 TRINITY_DN6318_c0_g1~~TRINITY_DN6318_c0_g1_i1.p1  ORF type:complete len:373 (+),score=64.92 TRINITY_DN6318_c0_g1_i1:36-1154(+)
MPPPLRLPEIALLVLGFGAWRDLGVAMRVCRQWQRKANDVLAARRKWTAFTLSDATSAEDDFTAGINALGFVPGLVLLFSTVSLPKVLLRAFEKALPPTAKLAGCRGTGVVAWQHQRKASPASETEAEKDEEDEEDEETDQTKAKTTGTAAANKKDRATEFEDGREFAVSVTVIPSHPRLRFATAFVERKATGAGAGAVPVVPEELASTARLVLLFPRHSTADIVPGLLSTIPHTAVVAGALGTNLYFGGQTYAKGVVCVTIAGDFQVEPVVLSHACADAAATVRALEPLRAKGPGSGCVMFACCGRGQEWYHATDFESGAISDAVPGAPVTGFFGNGEIFVAQGVQRRPAGGLMGYSTVVCKCTLPSNAEK